MHLIVTWETGHIAIDIMHMHIVIRQSNKQQNFMQSQRSKEAWRKSNLHSDSMTSECVENISGSCKVWYFCSGCTMYHIWDLKQHKNKV